MFASRSHRVEVVQAHANSRTGCTVSYLRRCKLGETMCMKTFNHFLSQSLVDEVYHGEVLLCHSFGPFLASCHGLGAIKKGWGDAGCVGASLAPLRVFKHKWGNSTLDMESLLASSATGVVAAWDLQVTCHAMFHLGVFNLVKELLFRDGFCCKGGAEIFEQGRQIFTYPMFQAFKSCVRRLELRVPLGDTSWSGWLAMELVEASSAV